ncbi:MAG: Dam family site-specific DNA-(adenine-N6)-methyltransferase [Candidatus Marithrix sp.]
MKVNIPPIKSQGIKTKLVPWIASILPPNFEGLWIEPFMGTGVVAFNIAPKKALLCDTNPHLINFYSAISSGEITPEIVRHYLIDEGNKLLEKGEIHERFNKEHQPLDFLFLNRAGFNGMIRFNKKGGFNVPFCRKPQRFAPAYITKIVNQVDYVTKLLELKPFNLKYQSFEKTIETGSNNDIIYCDPPYIGRHVDYYNGWNEDDEQTLYKKLSATKSKFILSTWHHNDYRENEYIKSIWKEFNILTREHFYHIGASEKNRSPMIEAIITNYDISPNAYQKPKKREQLMLF